VRSASCTPTDPTADPAPDCATGFQGTGSYILDSTNCPDGTCTYTDTSYTPPSLEDKVKVFGQTTSDKVLGLQFDGNADYATVQPENAGFADDGEFTVSFWATQTLCKKDGFETLYR
jgi:hypothetical protein